MSQSVIRTSLLSVLFLLSITSQACSDSGGKSNIQGKVVDYYQNTPIAGVKIIADTQTDILEEKKFEHLETKTDKKGNFLLKSLLPSYSYNIMVSAPGYSFQKTSMISPAKQTKLIEQPIRIIKLPKENGAYIFSAGKYIRLKPFDKINREHGILYTGMAVACPSIRYILENDLNAQNMPQVIPGSYLLMYGNQFRVPNRIWGGFMFPWYVHYLKKYPERSYKNGALETKIIPESYYCGLDFVGETREWGGHRYKANLNNVESQYQNGDEQGILLYRLVVPPGKYVITNFHNDAYVSAEDYSEQWSVGFLFEVI